MKIKLEIKDLSKFITAYNHAYLSFRPFLTAAMFGLIENSHMPKNLYDGIKSKLDLDNPDSWEQYLKDEMQILFEVYQQLLEIEKNEQNKSN